ncbi:Cupin domain [Raoultella planticola]|uniref:Cupin domain n=1 Tax=Raoultella planticola TaxID=575 RepID=A0A485AFW5_RAOPL|nr:Cupin domain [Raoultella planticola]
MGGATVTFEPGARTAWHTIRWVRRLIVTQGRGWLQEWGKEAQALNQGDIAWIPPGVKHWHGASSDTAMVHIAIAEAENGSRSPGWKK